jgi:hypothetical protein
MNIFHLDDDPKKCAQYHFDKHVLKMILESVQILCSVLILKKMDAPYKLSFQHHPCVLWASKSLSNWYWLKNLTKELNKEYQYRWRKNINHRSYETIKLFYPSNDRIKDLGITERPQMMPKKYQVIGDSIKAYRTYYLSEKRDLLKYTRRMIPEWIKRKIKK